MKRNKLNNFQKKQLTILCRKLLPEYQQIHFDRNTDQRMICLFLKTNTSDILDNCNEYVHWLALCMEVLLDLVAKHVSKDNPYLLDEKDLLEEFKFEFFRMCFIGNQHPVDFLYNSYNNG